MCGAGLLAVTAMPAKDFPRHNETILARISPGRTSMQEAKALWRNPTADDPESHSAIWLACDGNQLNVDFDEDEIIQAAWLSKTKTKPARGCMSAVAQRQRFSTGLGLQLGDAAGRVLVLYGAPDSRSPSTKDQQRLELLYYAFDWAGPDVPQMMEVLCTVEKDGKPGRVVEITLSAASL
jgi:hypothetical protein